MNYYNEFDGKTAAWLGRSGGRHINQAIKEEMNYATPTQTGPGEILSVLRSPSVPPSLRGSFGGLDGVQSEKVLLSFLRHYNATKASCVQGEPYAESLPRQGAADYEACGEQVCGLRCAAEADGDQADGSFGSPHQRGLEGQPDGEPSSSVYGLPLVLAQIASAAWEEYAATNATPIPLLATGVKNRVIKLRGYGNAIVPAVAAEFIKAYLKT